MTMDWIVTTGSTVEEALDVALDELSVTQDDIEFEIVKEGRNSIFGFRKSVIQVRARVRPIEPPAKREWKRPPKSEKRKRAKKQNTAAKPKAKKTTPNKQSANTKTNKKTGHSQKQQKASNPSKENNSDKSEAAAKSGNTRKRTINGSSKTSNIRSINTTAAPVSNEPSTIRRTRKIDH